MGKSHSSAPASKPADLEVAIRSRLYGKVPKATVGVRVATIRTGLSATLVRHIASHMVIGQEQLYSTLGLARATMIRKLKKRERMRPDESERVLGLAGLIGQVENMVARSGEPKGFDAAQWVAKWLEQPLPALGGKAPAEWMDTSEGQRLVSDMLARMESGAYA
jgi:putative toxin-antitoxin system antitoxin component (TIGR02293 family)